MTKKSKKKPEKVTDFPEAVEELANLMEDIQNIKCYKNWTKKPKK